MPDGISVTTIGNKTYLLTANEGDSRSDWDGMGNETEGETSPTGNVTLGDEVVWFNATMWDGLDQSKAYVFGGRSFSIYEVTGAGLTLTYDSGSGFEEITAEKLPAYFNCSNDKIGLDNRSGKKGPEPEAVITGEVNGKTYAFTALERIGGVMVYDITDPSNGKFVNYINSREFDSAIQGDVSPESLCFISAADSKTGAPLLLTACEVSGTLAVYEMTEKRFADVSDDAYYVNAVVWAADAGITNGATATTFGSNAICTRAQAVTFLWRAAGSPAPKSSVNPFSDVDADAYYYDAVLWAVENGVTMGTSASTFAPGGTCSRAQIVTFLWRSQKSPSAGAVNSFSDVADSVYYADAVVWAMENGITTGTTASTFSPNDNCTRAQIVTFLWRCMER